MAKIVISLRLDEKIVTMLRAQAKMEDRSFSNYIRGILKRHLKGRVK